MPGRRGAWRRRRRLEEVAAVLGHHYAAAGETERAVHYLEVAGDHAASVFAIDEAVASYCRAPAIVDQDGARDAMANAAVGLRDKLAEAVWTLGFLLLWHGDLAEAQEKLEVSLAIAERAGGPVRRAVCLCYLNVTALRRHDVEAVRSLAPRALAAAQVARYPMYVAAARAGMAWLAWKDQSFEDVVTLATEALELWGATVADTYPFKWLYLGDGGRRRSASSRSASGAKMGHG